MCEFVASSTGVCGGVSIGEMLDDRSVFKSKPDAKSIKFGKTKRGKQNLVNFAVFFFILQFL